MNWATTLSWFGLKPIASAAGSHRTAPITGALIIMFVTMDQPVILLVKKSIKWVQLVPSVLLSLSVQHNTPICVVSLSFSFLFFSFSGFFFSFLLFYSIDFIFLCVGAPIAPLFCVTTSLSTRESKCFAND